jgi:hypothetical protein
MLRDVLKWMESQDKSKRVYLVKRKLFNEVLDVELDRTEIEFAKVTHV